MLIFKIKSIFLLHRYIKHTYTFLFIAFPCRIYTKSKFILTETLIQSQIIRLTVKIRD